jgi:hypothetical protein
MSTSIIELLAADQKEVELTSKGFPPILVRKLPLLVLLKIPFKKEGGDLYPYGNAPAAYGFMQK